MSDNRMDRIDREMLMAATLAAGCCDSDTTGEQAIEILQEIMFQMAVKGGTLKMRQAATEIAKLRTDHQAASAKKPR